jgi:hypothetical protein
MRRLERDPRGYPVPFFALRDDQGRPHFTVIDGAKQTLAMVRDLCAICGQPLLRCRWFVGGPMSAFHPLGDFGDGPMHAECANYALRVCPYLAVPNYAGLIGARAIDPSNKARIVSDDVEPDRPQIFVAALATGQTYTMFGHSKPHRPYLRAQLWQRGEILMELDRKMARRTTVEDVRQLAAGLRERLAIRRA